MERTYRTLYRLRVTPWVGWTVPEALRGIVAGTGAPGIAVDLGCGTGEHARWLADRGWATTGVDFVEAALATARRRDPAGRVTWRRADVTRPAQVDPDGALAGTVRLLLDVGCLHGLSPAGRAGWSATVAHLAAPGATVLVRAAPPGRRGIGPAGIGGEEITALLPRSGLVTRDGGWYRFRTAETR